MWLDSFQSLSLSDSPPNPKINRSMSFNDVIPSKRIKVHRTVHTGPSGEAVLRQFSYEELSVAHGTSSLQLSKKFVSELQIDVPSNKKFIEFARIKNSLDNDWQKHCNKLHDIDARIEKSSESQGCKDFDFQSFSVPSKEKFSPQFNDKEQSRMISQKPKQEKKFFRRKKLLRLVPKRFSSRSTQSINGLLSSPDKMTKEGDKTCSFVNLSCFLWIVLPVLVILIATLGTQFAIHRKTCDTEIDFNAMEYLLSTTLFGQEKAIRQIVDIFKNFYAEKDDGLQVIIFTGNTGVGKTFAASILEEMFPWRFNIHHFIMPVDLSNLPHDKLYNYPYCGDHLVILDNLRDEDVKDAAYVVSYLQNLAAKKKAIAILIFKFHKNIGEITPQTDVMRKGSEIQSHLAVNGINSEVVQFKDLDKNAAIQCIKESLTRHWIPITDKTIDTILEQVDYHTEGCKRIPSKIALVNDVWVRNE